MPPFDPNSMGPLRPMPGYAPGFGDDAAPDPGMATAAPAPGADTSQSPNPFPTSTPPLVVPSAAPAPAAASPATAASRRAGAAVLLAGLGVGSGALLGGLWGAGSGLFFAGAAMNAYRARQLWTSSSPGDRAEAVKTTVMTIVGLGLGGYLGYRAHEARKEDD